MDRMLEVATVAAMMGALLGVVKLGHRDSPPPPPPPPPPAPPTVYQELQIYAPEGEGISIPWAGNYRWPRGTEILLSAFPAEGWGFRYWRLVKGGSEEWRYTRATILVLNHDYVAGAHFYRVVPEM